jgi:hypothetical protein
VKIAFPDHSKVDRLFARKRKLHLRAPSSQWQNGFEGMARVKAIPFENIEIKRNLPRAGAESLELPSRAPAQPSVDRSLSLYYELHPAPKVVLQLGGCSARRNENDRF